MNQDTVERQDNISKLSWDRDRIKKIVINVAKFIIWLAGLYGSCFISMEKIYFITSCFYFIFTNLGKRKEGQLSAYSVFNKGFKRLPGTFSPEEMLKGKSAIKQPQDEKFMDQSQQQKAKLIDKYFENQSKFANKPCYCRSDLKFKKCCLIRKKQEDEEEKKKRLQKHKNP